MDSLLESITTPSMIQSLNEEELYKLSQEAREFLISSISKTGGHLSSNLGVIELTLSIYKTFNLEKDKLVWDVGHQSYMHKLLTGRKNGFSKLRQYEGLSGFPKISESKYDSFTVGHSSTSISAALGIARARDIKKENYDVLAVIGDGALTGGMALEALNDVGFNKTNLIIVLNDNQMSISDNVGALSNHLNKLRLGSGYNKLKEDIISTLESSNLGKSLKFSMQRVKVSLKQLLVPSMFFEGMGIKYIGPIDGHDMKLMNEMFSKAKNINGPVVIHVITQKGRGYEFAEKNPNKFHGVSVFDLVTGNVESKLENTYSKVFGDTMLELANKDKDIVAITAAMPDGTGIKEFSTIHPKRTFDVGIAEEHAVTLAAGMASAGLKPVFVVYSTFLQRAYDQVLHDVCIESLPVTFAIDRAGIVGEDGETHQGVFDISYLSQIPNLIVLAPKQTAELPVLLKWAVNQNRPVAIRYPKGGDSYKDLMPIKKVEFGKWHLVSGGSKTVIIAVGKMVQFAMSAKEILKTVKLNPIVVSATFIKPLDLEYLKEIVLNEYNVITIEDNVINGGFGSYVLMELNKLNFQCKFKALGFEDKYIDHGNVNILYKNAGLNDEAIAKAVIELQEIKEK